MFRTAWSTRLVLLVLVLWSVVRYFLLFLSFDFGTLYEFWHINLLLHHSGHFGSQEAAAAVIATVWALSQLSKKFSEEVSHIENKIEISKKRGKKAL